MTCEDLIRLTRQGETSRVQFKRSLDNKDGIAAEMIAFANSKGGAILFGIEDKSGAVVGLDYSQLQETGNSLSTIANDFVKPQIFIDTEVVEIFGKCVLVVHVEEGVAKPYKDRNGTIWVKQGGDKRKLTDNNEQIRLFQQNGLLFADEMVVPMTSVDDVDSDKVRNYLEKIEDSENDLPPELLYRNLNMMNGGKMTLGGLLFFAKNPQRYRPAFCIKAVSFFGTDMSGMDYRDSEDIGGTVPQMFERGMSFLTRNLHHVQAGQNFNSTGVLEVSKIALEELLQNALTHRDYTKNSPINLLIFDDRIEIMSPGSLPNSLTIENIKYGNAVVRNNLVVSFSSKLMKYRGLGSGIRRALREQPNLNLIDDKDGDRFMAVIPRPSADSVL